MAGLRVGQAFGMFLLPGFGVGISNSWVPGHPTSMCDSGVKFFLTETSGQYKGRLLLVVTFCYCF